jgi:hypothetical protein
MSQDWPAAFVASEVERDGHEGLGRVGAVAQEGGESEVLVVRVLGIQE